MKPNILNKIKLIDCHLHLENRKAICSPWLEITKCLKHLIFPKQELLL
jgi:hypothetical protein